MAKIIAELSGNHGGDLCRCLTMIEVAKKCGCWAAKFQLFKPEDLPDYEPANIVVPTDWLPHLFRAARALDIEIFASVFAPWAVKELTKHGCRCFKIASPGGCDLGDEVYYKIRGQIPHPMSAITTTIFSADQANLARMKQLFDGIPLYCKPGYPTTIDIDDVKFMAENAAGFSDHTIGIMGSLAMAAAGAQYIEKHFKLDDNCVDAAFSIDPHEMKTLCELTK